MPEISIVTPIHADEPNKLDWLNQMIESLKAQTFTNWECILIDDFSPLSIDEIQLKHKNEFRLRWYKTSKQFGPAMVRNSAVALTESEAILPLDADDMLANPEALRRLYRAWNMDRRSIAYGNLQVLQQKAGSWERGKVVDLGQYDFEGMLSLNGNIPVTALHNRQGWLQVGGWKQELAHGREDVEYWIAMGKAGYCGTKLDHTTLIYRRHESSRDYKLKYELQKVEQMNAIIRELHADIYKGEYPMGCCGKGKGNNNQIAMSSNSYAPSTLEEIPDNLKVWVEYTGNRQASFSIVGRSTRANYMVYGPGHKLEVHKDDIQVFKGMERGKAFIVGIMPPAYEKEKAVADPYEYPEPPEMATLISDTPSGISQTVIAEIHGIESLGLSGTLTETLESSGWTIESLAKSVPADLIPLKGIGQARAEKIIALAQEGV